MAVVYQKSKGLQDTELHYCPGCHHGIIHKLVAEVLEEMGMLDTAIGVMPVGCSVLGYKYFNIDTFVAAHGRAPATATAIKRCRPDQPVFTYQGDGDLASIGAGEIVHATMRGEKFTTIFINNGIYGMTGGQMAPTTLIGQRATTCPTGRTAEQAGMPIRMAEMLSTLDGMAYATRCCVTDIPNIIKTKKAIKKAFEYQMDRKGFTFVEVLSACPTNWGLSPEKAIDWVKEKMIPYYPIGDIKDIG